MKCCKVSEKGVASLLVRAEPYPHIPIGESGRGRCLDRFPLGRRFAEGIFGEDDTGHVEQASIIKTREKSTLLLVEERVADDRRALVHLAIAAGFRGGTAITGGEKVEVPWRRRREHVEGSVCPFCGVACTPISEGSVPGYNHPDDGVELTYAEFPPAGITVLAKGYCAEGAAGRMGGHAEYLVIMEPGTTMRVERYGRLYGAPSELFVHWDGQGIRVGTYDIVFPPSELPEEGELI